LIGLTAGAAVRQPRPVLKALRRKDPYMREIIYLNDGWYIKPLEPIDRLENDQLKVLQHEDCDDKTNKWIRTSLPAQVHEILLKEGVIEDPNITGKAKECLWVAEQDWVYKCTFKIKQVEKRTYLHFNGLDTLVDVYLNGEFLAHHNDMFLPLKIEVTGKLKKNNRLVLHFHTPHTYLEARELPEKWNGKINKTKLLRTGFHGFDDYLGGRPYLTTIGVFDQIFIETIDAMQIVETDVHTVVSEKCSKANICISVKAISEISGGLHVTIKNPDGSVIGEHKEKVQGQADTVLRPEFEFTVERPQLWWPRGYGDQPLYEITIKLIDLQLVEKDFQTKKIGIRKIEMESPFDFYINNKQVKLWGGNFTPMHGISYCWDNLTATILLEMAENCNMNIIRIWGEGSPYPDSLYDEADQRGLLIWQDFYMGFGMYPNNKDYRELCKSEAEHLIKRLKHHPSILLWCGGNESFMGRDFTLPGMEYIGEEIFKEDFKRVCSTLDPSRYYHISSPYGGGFANDPLAGDTHSYTNTWYVPGADYPIFASENLRVSPPAMKSLRRFVEKDKLWPANYSGLTRYEDPYPWPDGWTERSSAEGWKKIPPIERFYDADNPESMVYKFGAAHGLFLRETVERYRRGRPSENVLGERECKGHIVWKLNSTWPHIYSAVIDYYLEPYIPYYVLKRAYEPVLLTFDIQNHIYLWVVNDSPNEVKGEFVVELFHPDSNQTIKKLSGKLSVKSGNSKVVIKLDEFGQFSRENILFAHLTNENGEVIARTNDFVDIERHLKFPQAKLDLQLHEETLYIKTDTFARCIELTGNNNGEEFGWLFEDNYFDLLPGEIKKVRVLGRHKQGKISAKAHYSDRISVTMYSAPDNHIKN
jgi:beta-mannosidase